MMNVNGAPNWRRSTHCGANGTCVEVAALASPGSLIGARDAKRGERSPVLTLTRAEWRAFLTQVKSGSLDGPA
ncbi:DUF397 domain-containing protein [Actinomadura kijaniata]|uniref:DUF397 domain-containing protein n=1 Tax=Actinomadura kijaniata TaxID=46161 RepID=UPI003F1C8621